MENNTNINKTLGKIVNKIIDPINSDPEHDPMEKMQMGIDDLKEQVKVLSEIRSALIDEDYEKAQDLSADVHSHQIWMLPFEPMNNEQRLIHKVIKKQDPDTKLKECIRKNEYAVAEEILSPPKKKKWYQKIFCLTT